jgi:hypothetical protein
MDKTKELNDHIMILEEALKIAQKRAMETENQNIKLEEKMIKDYQEYKNNINKLFNKTKELLIENKINIKNTEFQVFFETKGNEFHVNINEFFEKINEYNLLNKDNDKSF